MIEAEWLACGEPVTMLKFLAAQASDRKLRLFMCDCCACVCSLMTDPLSQAALLAAEQFAEGGVTAAELEAASSAAFGAAEELYAETHETERAAAIAKGLLSETDETFGIWEYARAVSAPANAAVYASYPTGDNLLWAAEEVVTRVAVATGHAAESMFAENYSPERQEAVMWVKRAELARNLRDIFGNPFHPVTFLSEWRTSTVLALAQQMYDSRDFSAMPILADALQDAGCADEALLAHCREPGAHVRGCWVVDLVLGRE